TNIIDMTGNTLCATRGVLKPKPDDKLYYYESTFNNSPAAEKAVGIIKKWPLFQDHPELQDQILNFISVTFTPEQIIEMSGTNSLAPVCVPIQEEFRIGRFTERRNPERVCNETFLRWLESLKKG